MVRAYQQDRKWSDKFIEQIKPILGTYLISVAPFVEDAEHNTDLIVLGMEGIRVACRIRQEFYLYKYADEFTIRYERPSGAKTELAKILEGWGDYLFYGFGMDNGLLGPWVLGNLDVFRHWVDSERARLNGIIPGAKIWNRDESSSFMVYNIAALPRGFIIAREMSPELSLRKREILVVKRGGKPSGYGKSRIQYQNSLWRCQDCNRACPRGIDDEGFQVWRCPLCGVTRRFLERD